MPAEIAFWQDNGMRLEFELDLSVPDQKRPLLRNECSTTLRLSYLSFNGTGVEFLCHSPSPPEPVSSAPGITLALHGSSIRKCVDPDQNRFVTDPGLAAPVSLVVKTSDASASASLLQSLGFAPAPLEDKELISFHRLGATMNAGYVLCSPLFRKNAVRIVFAEDRSRSMQPKVDSVGWNGLSLFARDLDALGSLLPLRSHQRIAGRNGGLRELAFYSGAGLVLEFLTVVH